MHKNRIMHEICIVLRNNRQETQKRNMTHRHVPFLRGSESFTSPQVPFPDVLRV